MKKKAIVKTLSIVLAAALLLTGCTLGKTDALSMDTEESVSEEAEVEEPEEEPVIVEPVITEEKEEEEEEEPEEQEPIPEGMMKSTITGEYISEELGMRRPLTFMIDNAEGAVPQSGISQASMYFEAPVEGKATRICAVFEDYDDLERIGPLRSCRDYFLSLCAGLDEIYEHYGQAAYALPYLESDDVDNISGLAWYAEGYFYRDNTYHEAPHNAYTSGALMNAAIEFLGYRQNHEEDYESQYNFNWVGETTDMSEGREASYFAPGYVINTPWFQYDAETGLYKRYQYGGEHIDVENGEQLEVKNILVEFQNYDNYQDSPYLHFDVAAGAGGEGLYITEGKCIDITWQRPNFYDPVTYYDTDGNELKINTGKTWTCVIQNEYLGNARIGSSAEDCDIVTTQERIDFAGRYNSDWKAAYKNSEEVYLSGMAKQREENLAKHNGQSKVEG